MYITFEHPPAIADSERVKDWINFYHPMGGWPKTYDGELEYQIQIGSKMIPEYQVKSIFAGFL